MDRSEYNKCVGDRMRGLHVPPGERRLAFCTSAKICSGKTDNEEEALNVCKESASQPKAKSKKQSKSGGGMKVILLTTTDCPPCLAAKQYLKEHIEKGDVEVLDIQKSDFAADLVAQNNIMGIPKLFVIDSDGKPFSELQIMDTEQTI